MFKKLSIILNSNWTHTVLFFLVFAIAFILRAHGYERTPGVGHLDEQLYALSGVSLIQTGTPVSWSTLDYPKSAEVYKGEINYKGGDPKASVTLFKPWLDEPPLFSYLVGFFANKFGVKLYDFAPSSFIRYPMVLLSSVTTVFVFLIAIELSGFYVGILAMLVYGTIPIFVFASRSAMPETLISLVFSILVYLVLKFRKFGQFRYILTIPFLIGIAGLSKPTGFFIILFAVFFVFSYWYKKNMAKNAFLHSLYLILLTIPFVIIFFWWGYHFDREIFMRINAIQSMRPVGFGSLAWFFITPSSDTVILHDSWFIFGLLSSGYFLIKGFKNEKFVVLMAFAFWVGIVMISGGENDLLSWYRFPSYPMMAILISWSLMLLVKKANIFSMFIAAGMLLGNRMLLVNPFHPNVIPAYYRVIICFLMIIPLLYYIFRKKCLKIITRSLIVGLIIIGIFFNTKYIYNAFEIACQSKSCAIVPSTNLSELRIPYFWRFLVMNRP